MTTSTTTKRLINLSTMDLHNPKAILIRNSRRSQETGVLRDLFFLHTENISLSLLLISLFWTNHEKKCLIWGVGWDFKNHQSSYLSVQSQHFSNPDYFPSLRDGKVPHLHHIVDAWNDFPQWLDAPCLPGLYSHWKS
jgi:hypothetical protein